MQGILSVPKLSDGKAGTIAEVNRTVITEWDQEFTNNDRTKQEDQPEAMFQVVEEYRRRYPKTANKRDLLQWLGSAEESCLQCLQHDRVQRCFSVNIWSGVSMSSVVLNIYVMKLNVLFQRKGNIARAVLSGWFRMPALSFHPWGQVRWCW